jgi:hypothetical protein
MARKALISRIGPLGKGILSQKVSVPKLAQEVIPRSYLYLAVKPFLLFVADEDGFLG